MSVDLVSTHLKETKSSNDFSRISLVRVFAIFLIVLAHVSGWGGDVKWTSALYYTITRMGVPLFFMCTGYFLLSEQQGIYTFFKKHLFPLLISFFVWSAIYDMMGDNVFAKEIPILAFLKIFLRTLHTARIGYFWFYYALIGLYFFIPIMRHIIAKARNMDIFYILGLWFFDFAIIPIIRSMVSIKYGLEISIATRYLGYFLLGYYLPRLQITPRNLIFTLGVLIISFSFTYTVFYFNLPPTDNEDFFRSYLSFNIIFMAVSSFIVIYWIGKRLPTILFGLFEFFDRTTFGIYLMHLIVMGWIATAWKSLGFHAVYGSPLIIPTIATITLLISSAITYMLQKIPLINNAVPRLGKS